LHELRQSGNQSLGAVREASARQLGHVGQIARKYGDRTSVGTIVALRCREIGIDVVRERIRGLAPLRVTQEPRIRGVEHMRDGVSDEFVLRLEVRIEAAVGESGSAYDFCHSDALDPLAPDRGGSLGEDAGACSVLVVLVVPHRLTQLRLRMLSMILRSVKVKRSS